MIEITCTLKTCVQKCLFWTFFYTQRETTPRMDATELVSRFRRPTPFFRDATRDAAAARTVEVIMDLAAEINHLTPDGREKSLAFTHLEEVEMWVIEAIRRNGILP